MLGSRKKIFAKNDNFLQEPNMIYISKTIQATVLKFSHNMDSQQNFKKMKSKRNQKFGHVRFLQTTAVVLNRQTVTGLRHAFLTLNMGWNLPYPIAPSSDTLIRER